MLSKTLHISTSPHLTKGLTTTQIMKNVVYALLPVAAYSVYAFGWDALLLIGTTTLSALMTEHYLCKWSGKKSTVGDWSAVITGLLLGMTLPPAFPLWMGFLGGVIAIGLGKYAFGGLGNNTFNPALVGRAVLQAAFPVAITTWSDAFDATRFNELSSSVLTMPFMKPAYDAISGATPLSAFKFNGTYTEPIDLALGMVSGSAGETNAILILIGGTYLAVRKMLNWRIPLTIFGTVYLISAAFHQINPEVYPPATFMIFSGGLMLGAVFMATDMVASPITAFGVFIYGALIGILIVVIRLWGGLPEGVMYAILLANTVSPHIDKVTQHRVYGTKKQMA